MGSSTGRTVVPVALFVVAAAYFLLGWNVSLEWMDEGHLVYQAWRVAEGALPHRDIHHLYGPSSFFLNGFLLRLFGADVLVIRASLVVVEAFVAVLVYGFARRAASWPLALLAYACLVTVWGGPWWVFHTPYASHYGTALAFAGWLVLLSVPARFQAGCFAAGLCFGLAATFKQTSGLFPFVGLVWFLLYERTAGESGTAAWLARRVPPRLVGLLRWAALLVPAAVVAPYVLHGANAWSAAVLLTPAAAAVALLAAREARWAPAPEERARALIGILLAAAGTAVPLAATVLCYAYLGALGGLGFDTLWGIPRYMRWSIPFPVPALPTVCAVITILALLAALRIGATSRAGRPHRGSLVALLGVAVGAGGFWLYRVASARRRFMRHAWYGDVFALTFWLPLAVIWTATPRVFTARRSNQDQPSGTGVPRALAAAYFFAVVTLLQLHPAADVWHVLSNLPVSLVLAAHLLDGSFRPPARRAGGGVVHAIAAAFVAVLAAGLAAPHVHGLWLARRQRPAGLELERATWITDRQPGFADAVALVRYLNDPERAGEPIFVAANQQMIYFLTARRSVVEGDEFYLYLVEANLIPPGDARALVDEERLIDRLEATLPLVIDDDGASGRRLRAAFPALGEYIERHYQEAARFGSYRVLRPVERGAPSAKASREHPLRDDPGASKKGFPNASRPSRLAGILAGQARGGRPAGLGRTTKAALARRRRFASGST